MYEDNFFCLICKVTQTCASAGIPRPSSLLSDALPLSCGNHEEYPEYSLYPLPYFSHLRKTPTKATLPPGQVPHADNWPLFHNPTLTSFFCARWPLKPIAFNLLLFYSKLLQLRYIFFVCVPSLIFICLGTFISKKRYVHPVEIEVYIFEDFLMKFMI